MVQGVRWWCVGLALVAAGLSGLAEAQPRRIEDAPPPSADFERTAKVYIACVEDHAKANARIASASLSDAATAALGACMVEGAELSKVLTRERQDPVGVMNGIRARVSEMAFAVVARERR